MSDTIFTIVLKGMGHHDEGEADAVIYPGEAVRLAADGLYDPEPLAAQLAAGRGLKIAKEDALQGKTVAQAYADGDILFFYSPLPGDHVHVLVKSGENIDVGDYLAVEGSGSGLFTEVSSSGSALYHLPLTQARVHNALASLLPAPSGGTFKIPITAGKTFDALATDLPAAATDDDMGIITGTPGSDGPTLQGVDFGATTADEKASFEYIVPQAYRSGGTITVRARAAMLTTVSDANGPTTLDVSVWKDAGDGAVGADLCTTAAQNMNSLTPANFDFTVTPTGIVAGDRLIIQFSFAGDDATNAGVMIQEISNIDMILGAALGLADDLALITGTPGTDAPTLQGVDFGGGTSDEKAAFEFIIPQEYRAGGTFTIRVNGAVLTTVADDACTVDVEAWEDAGDGSVGADLCSTAAQSINSLTAADKDFTITPTGLSPGDRLFIRVSIAGVDAGDAGVMIAEIKMIAAVIANAVAGQLEALEDSDGALASDTLIRCRVLNP